MQNQRVKIPTTPWNVVEEGWQEENNLYFESNFTLGFPTWGKVLRADFRLFKVN